jgi:hypothetical protein
MLERTQATDFRPNASAAAGRRLAATEVQNERRK